MLQHFHAGDYVKAARRLGGQRFGTHFAVAYARGFGFQRVQLRHAQSFGREIDAQHVGATARHGVGQDASAATHVQRGQPLHRAQRIDPLQTQGVDLVQGAEFAVLVPPAVGQLREFGQFGRVGIGAVWGVHKAIIKGLPVIPTCNEKDPPKRVFVNTSPRAWMF